MSKALDALREIGIYNPYNASTAAKARGGVGVFVSFTPQDTGRAYRAACWQVIRPGYKTDPDGHYRDNGHKTFSIYDADKQAQRDEAIAWASKRYGVTEWVKIPGLGSDLFPRGDAAIVKQMLKDGESR